MWSVLRNVTMRDTPVRSTKLRSPFLSGYLRRPSCSGVLTLVIPCTNFLRAYKAHTNNPKTLEIRRHTRRAWQAALDEMVRRQIGQRDPNWRQFLAAWRRIGDLIPSVPESNETPSRAFEPLRRCGWSECLCNVHKPAHKLRVCKGCWVVAYCSKKCQTRCALCAVLSRRQY